MDSEWRYFVCKTGSSNKFWQYRFTGAIGASVEKQWGRIGGHVDTQIKNCTSRSEAQSYAAHESGKKLAKGYVEVQQDALASETGVASKLGWSWKIDVIEFIGEDWPSGLDETKARSYNRDTSNHRLITTSANGYDPKRGVYVELLQSYTKERVHMLINKQQAIQFSRGGLVNGYVNVTSAQYSSASQNFAEGVRMAIRTLYQAVEDTISRFAAMGVRSLDLDDGVIDDTKRTGTAAWIQDVAAKTGTSAQVIKHFASMGSRALEI